MTACFHKIISQTLHCTQETRPGSEDSMEQACVDLGVIGFQANGHGQNLAALPNSFCQVHRF